MRTSGYAASTQVVGEVAEEPAGRESEVWPRVPVAAKGSPPETIAAPPDSDQVELSKSPPGASSYQLLSAHGVNAWLSGAALQGLRLIGPACARLVGSATRAVALSAPTVERRPTSLVGREVTDLLLWAVLGLQ
jgi:hypothetical protein